MAKVNKLNVNRGTTYAITVNYEVDGVAATLVGGTVFFTVKNAEYSTDATDADALVSKTKTTFVATGDNAAAGIAVVTLNPSDTSTITPGSYYYDVKVKNAAGAIYKIDEGRFILDGSPTNRQS